MTSAQKCERTGTFVEAGLRGNWGKIREGDVEPRALAAAGTGFPGSVSPSQFVPRPAELPQGYLRAPQRRGSTQ